MWVRLIFSCGGSAHDGFDDQVKGKEKYEWDEGFSLLYPGDAMESRRARPEIG